MRNNINKATYNKGVIEYSVMLPREMCLHNISKENKARIIDGIKKGFLESEIVQKNLLDLIMVESERDFETGDFIISARLDVYKLRESLVNILSDYFDLNDTYCYNLTRDKEAFSLGTMSLDDFEEFDDETVNDLAEFIIRNVSQM